MMLRRLGTIGPTLILAVVVLGGGDARADLFTVDAQSGPWLFSSTLNSDFTYGDGSADLTTVIGGRDGFNFAAGGIFHVDYVAGLTDAFAGPPAVDGVGYSNGYDASDNPGSTGKFFPSLYVDRRNYPVWLNALIGTFADDAGKIVGQPFYVGNATTVMAPLGATRLQLGINDNFLPDNNGFLIVNVTGPRRVPEPTSIALMVVGLAGAAIVARRRTLRPG